MSERTNGSPWRVARTKIEALNGERKRDMTLVNRRERHSREGRINERDRTAVKEREAAGERTAREKDGGREWLGGAWYVAPSLASGHLLFCHYKASTRISLLVRACVRARAITHAMSDIHACICYMRACVLSVARLRVSSFGRIVCRQ